MLTLRPYQQAAIASIYGYFEKESGNPLVVIPTAGGKSLVMAAFIDGVLKAWPDQRVLVVTHARVSHDDEDLLLQHYIDAATAWLDGPAGTLGRCLVTQTWRAELAVVTRPVHLPFPDSVIDSAVFSDEEGGDLAYHVVMQDQRPLLRPTTRVGRPAAITFTAGYGGPTDVPAAIRQAMLLLVTQWYEHRQVTGAGSALPFAVEALLAPYRRVRL